jgi:hypothetical protein
MKGGAMRRTKLLIGIMLAIVATLMLLVMVMPVAASSGGGSSPGDLMTNFIAIADSWKLVTLSVLVFVVLALGVINALLQKQLLLRRLWDISGKRLVAGMVGYYALCFAGAVHSELASLATAAFAAFTAVLVGDILANLKELGVPFPLPDSLTKFLTGAADSNATTPATPTSPTSTASPPAP